MLKQIKWLRCLKQTGDTIVEVMIVLTVLGLALSISYATANRSLLNARQAQEDSEATQLAQGQVEALRTMTGYISTDSNYIFRPGTFCITDYPFTVVPYTGSSTPAQCLRNNLYNVAIIFDSGSSNFKVEVSWPDVDGEGTDIVTLIYKLYTPA